MERKIGEIFEYDGIKLEVVETEFAICKDYFGYWKCKSYVSNR